MTTPGMGLPMPNFISDNDQSSNTITLLDYGLSGVGKTRLLGSAEDVPEMRDILFIDIEAGTRSIRDRKFKRAKIDNWDQFKQTINWVMTIEPCPFKTINVDSLTELVKIATTKAIEEDMLVHPSRDMDIASLQDWQRAMLRVTRAVMLLKKSKFNFLCTALAVDQKDEMTGLVTTKPSLPGKLADEIPAHFDIVGYHYATISGGVIKRQMQFVPTRNFTGKDRTGRLPTILEDPTMLSIYRLINPEPEPVQPDKKKG